ncbi:hypothetical protein BB561_006387 [Smittium simulii]|uniref:Uncharacterized protein n=1 Tax=Smittium simulii TaxID=133385 RepID=A0A2T9Y4P4_9FUNG|nr:hypothetical protein BB561_006387 [Smittium simulii]
MPNVPSVSQNATNKLSLSLPKRTRLEYSTVAKTGLIDPVYMGCYSILKRSDMPTKFKVMVINAMIQEVATYGGELFGMSATRCKPIQQVVDAATRTLAKTLSLL